MPKILSPSFRVECDDECGRRAWVSIVYPPTGGTDYLCIAGYVSLTFRVLRLRITGRDPWAII